MKRGISLVACWPVKWVQDRGSGLARAQEAGAYCMCDIVAMPQPRIDLWAYFMPFLWTLRAAISLAAG